MDNTPDHSPVPWPEKSKFDISQLDHIFSLYDLPASNSEEDKNEILPNSFLKSMNVDRPLSLNRLFEDEDIYLGDSSLAGLDSHTLPSLFRVSGRRHQKAKNADRGFNEKRLRELLWSEERLDGMSLCVCEFAGLVAESSLTLPEHSPLASLVPSDCKCSLAHVLKEVLRFALRNIHEAIVQETNCAPQTKASLEKKAATQLETPSIADYDELCQSVGMSDVNSQCRRTHKKWTRAEETELLATLSAFDAHKVPEELWDELAAKFDRTVCSLHAKAKSLQRGADAGSREGKTYSAMIAGILSGLPNQAATKEEIVSLICERYNIEKSEVEKSVLQCLAKKFERCPGVYRLSKGARLLPSKDAATKSTKDRLVYILNFLLPSGEGTLAQIRAMYQQEFKDDLDTKISANSKQAVWEKTVSKTLLKCAEFDKSKAKTKYTFKKTIGL